MEELLLTIFSTLYTYISPITSFAYTIFLFWNKYLSTTKVRYSLNLVHFYILLIISPLLFSSSWWSLPLFDSNYLILINYIFLFDFIINFLSGLLKSFRVVRFLNLSAGKELLFSSFFVLMKRLYYICFTEFDLILLRSRDFS